MEQNKARGENSQILSGSTAEGCQLFCCPFHDLSFAIDSKGKVYSADPLETIEWEFPDEIVQIVASCQQDLGSCRFFFRSLQNQVYEWNLNTSEEHFKKRVKLNDGSAERPIQGIFTVIAKNTHYIMPFETPGVVLFSEDKIQYLNAETEKLTYTSIYNATDTTISCERFTNRLDICLTDFFSIDSLSHGLVYGTHEGFVYIRNLDKNPVQDTKIFKFEGTEAVKFIDLVSIPSLSNEYNTIVAVGNQGTIMTYSKASGSPSETSVLFNQFSIQGPILSIDQADEKAKYLVTSGSGIVSLIKLQFTDKEVKLELTETTPVFNNVKKLKVLNSKNHTFDSICNYEGQACFESKCRYKATDMTNNSEDIKQAIGQALAQLELSESSIRELANKEQDLSQKLASINKTLYALQSINSKRKLGLVNSLESTGFEFSMRPIIKSQSIANSSLHLSTFLRICIKTSRFLELEDWDLKLDLYSPRLSSSSEILGQTKIVSVMGFEPHFENGIEKYSIWERDIELDLDKIRLPLEVSATLTLSIDEYGSSPLLFPIAKIMTDDLHYLTPLSSDLIMGIERRGLEEVSNRLIESFNKQKLFDKTGRYPFARLLNKKLLDKKISSPSKKVFNYRELHIRCSVDMHMTNDSYRSILSAILNEGRTIDDMKNILPSAEQAIFSLAAFPGCPIIVKLSRVSSTMIDICVQCTYLPALFKTEAAILIRLYEKFIKPCSESDTSQGQQSALLKKLKTLEKAILDIQDKYQNVQDQMEIDENETMIEQLKTPIDLFYSIHNEKSIGQLHINLQSEFEISQ